MSQTSAPWTLKALGTAVAIALRSVDYEGPENGQIRAVPNGRTIRYYTTLGLLDRPTAFEGRTAYYGPDHLRQIVAIKRLQVQGMPLVEVQQRLAGMPKADIRRLADVEAVIAEIGDDPTPNEHPAPTSAPKPSNATLSAKPNGRNATRGSTRQPAVRRAADFWTQPAAPLSSETRAFDDEDGGSDNSAATPTSREMGPTAQFLGTAVCDDLIVLIKGAPRLTDDDEEAIRHAAGPLLAVLQERGLLPTHTKGNA